MNTTLRFLAIIPIAAIGLSGCRTERLEAFEAPQSTTSNAEATLTRWYGAPFQIGNGQARAYVLTNVADAGDPVEIGVALDSAAMHGLPTDVPHVMAHLELPSNVPAPYKFVMFGWNPQGHEPEGVYNRPHFDFHFYTTSHEEVARIQPTNPDFAKHANNVPASEEVPPFYVALAAPGGDPASAAVPEMGVHWLDTRSPELQAIFGKPEAFETFTKTFIYGSWNGRITFYEPMITREFLLTRPDEVVPVPTPAKVTEAGWYPSSYRISYDRQAQEYRIALTDLQWRQ